VTDTELEILFKDQYRPLVYFADKIISNQYEAEDIVSESFVKLWNKRSDFPNKTAAKSFLYLVVRNSCFDYLKKQKRLFKKESGYFVWTDDVEQDISFLIMQAETLKEITNMIENLPVKKREICKLAYFEGLSTEEISDRLGIPIKTVRNQRALGINIIKERV
jgi:RNA polymerase sigma-70 factor (family 1)